MVARGRRSGPGWGAVGFVAAVVLAAAGGGRAELYDHSRNVVRLNDGNFEKEVLKSTEPWLVQFYAPWNGASKVRPVPKTALPPLPPRPPLPAPTGVSRAPFSPARVT